MLRQLVRGVYACLHCMGLQTACDTVRYNKSIYVSRLLVLVSGPKVPVFNNEEAVSQECPSVMQHTLGRGPSE
jgi:hypothetical protein